MTQRDEDRVREVWKTSLARTPDCIPLEELSEPLSALRAQHLAGCPLCQSEMAMWREFQEAAPRSEDGAAVAWIEQELRRRAETGAGKRWWWRNLMQVPMLRWSGAFATLLVLSGVMVVYMVQSRRGAVLNLEGEAALRSQVVTVVAPMGDVDALPAELRWQPVVAAVRYSVEILEVDRHSLWKTETVQTRLAIPGNIRTMIVPGKTLLWKVSAISSTGIALATSGLQKFRVVVKKSAQEEL